MLERTQAAGRGPHLPERRGVAPGLLACPSSPEGEAGPGERILPHELAGPAVGVERGVEHAELLPHVPQPGPHRRLLVIGHIRQPAGGVQRGLVVGGGLDVGVGAAGPLRSQAGPVPGLLVVLGHAVVVGEQIGHLVDPSRGQLLGDDAGRPVELAAATERQPFVGDVAGERLAESPAVLAVRLEEARQVAGERVAGIDPVAFQQQPQASRHGSSGRGRTRSAAPAAASGPGRRSRLRPRCRASRAARPCCRSGPPGGGSRGRTGDCRWRASPPRSRRGAAAVTRPSPPTRAARSARRRAAAPGSRRRRVGTHRGRTGGRP